MQRPPRIYVDVALTPCDCSTPGCQRTIQAGDVLHMQQLSNGSGPQVCFPLCPVCAASAIEDQRVLARLRVHAQEQAVQGRPVRPRASAEDWDERLAAAMRCMPEEAAVQHTQDVYGPRPRPLPHPDDHAAKDG